MDWGKDVYVTGSGVVAHPLFSCPCHASPFAPWSSPCLPPSSMQEGICQGHVPSRISPRRTTLPVPYCSTEIMFARPQNNSLNLNERRVSSNMAAPKNGKSGPEMKVGLPYLVRYQRGRFRLFRFFRAESSSQTLLPWFLHADCEIENGLRID